MCINTEKSSYEYECMLSFIVHYQTHFHSQSSYWAGEYNAQYCTFGWLKYVRQYCFQKSNIFANTLKLSLAVLMLQHCMRGVASDSEILCGIFSFPLAWKMALTALNKAWLMRRRRYFAEEKQKLILWEWAWRWKETVERIFI